MPADRLLTDDGVYRGGRVNFLWMSLLGFLVGIWLWLALSSGGYPAGNWVFPVLVLGLFGVVVGSLVAYPRRPAQLSLTVLLLFGAYSAWSVLSTLWAGSDSRAWLASGRTFAYLLILVLALSFLTSSRARVAFRYLIMLAAFVLLAVSIWRIWSAPVLTELFSSNRLIYPAGRADSTAALFLVSFWPLMWLAAGPNERAPVRGAALGLATGLLGLAVLTHSRGAAWSMVITLLLMFLFSPGRLRLLFYLVVPGLLMVYAAPSLNRYWTLDPGFVQGSTAGRTLTIAVIAAAFMGLIIALLEGWVRVSGRMKAVFGTVVLVGCAAGLIYAAVTTPLGGGSISWVDDTWRQFLDEPAVGQTAGGEPGETPLPTRESTWTQTWEQFKTALVLGAGADNSSLDLGDPGQGPGGDLPREPQQPNSVVLQVLSDTGIVGAVFGFAAIVAAVAGMLWPRLAVGFGRFRRAWHGDQGDRAPSRWGDDPMAYGWNMALFVGVAYWFVHANMEWLWPIPGVTIPALLMMAAGVAATDARAGTLWPRLSDWSRRRTHAGLAYGTEETAAARSVSPATGPASMDPQQAPLGSHSRWSPQGRLRPPGPLSQGFRVALITLSAFVLILAGSAYLLLLI